MQKPGKNLGFIISVLTFYFIWNACEYNVVDPADKKYFPDVKRIIQESCMSCHNSAGTWAGRPVAFDTDSAIAESYQIIKAAVADPVSPLNRRMPETGTLSQTDIDVIVHWFEKGGKITD